MRPLGATWHDKHVAHVASKPNFDCSRVLNAQTEKYNEYIYTLSSRVDTFSSSV